MKNTERFEQFLDNIRTHDEPFKILSGNFCGTNRYDFFLQRKIGNGKQVYIQESYNIEDTCRLDKLGIKLIAIVIDDIIWLTTNVLYSFNFHYDWINVPLSDTVKALEVKELEDFKQTVFNEFYEALEPVKAENDWRDPKQDARDYVLREIGKRSCEYIDSFYEMKHLIAYKLHLMDLKEFILSRLNDNLNMYKQIKYYYNQLNYYIANPLEIAEQWELDLAEGLSEHRDKKVTVEFESDGHVAAAKIEARRVLFELSDKGTFSSYDFCNGVEGKCVLTTLGKGGYDEAPLTCKDIRSITFARKILYQRAEK